MKRIFILGLLSFGLFQFHLKAQIQVKGYAGYLPGSPHDLEFGEQWNDADWGNYDSYAVETTHDGYSVTATTYGDGIYPDTLYINSEFGPDKFFLINSLETFILDVETDSKKNIYLLGRVKDSIVFDPGLEFNYPLNSNLLIKLDSHGIYQWHEVNARIEGYDLEMGGNNSFVMVGADTNRLMHMVKYTDFGAPIDHLANWADTFAFCEVKRAVYLADSNCFFITGTFFDSITFGGTGLKSFTESMFIARIEENSFSAPWATMAYPYGAADGTDIELDTCGNPVALGTRNIISPWGTEMYLHRYRPNGEYLGGMSWNGQARVTGTGLDINDSNRMFFSGHHFDTLYTYDSTFIGYDTCAKGYIAYIDACLLEVSASSESHSLSYSSKSVKLTGYPSGGTFSGLGVNGNEFDPSVAGPGDHDITYTLNDCGCTDSYTFSIDVDCYPDVNYSEYSSIHQELTQNYPHFKRKESDYFIDSVPHPEIPSLKIAKQRLITVSTTQDGSGNIYVALIEDDGDIVWTRKFGGNSRDRGTAAKKVSDGFLIAGTTLSYGSSKQKPFLLKLNQDGSVKWFRIYEISNHVLSVNVEELNNGDIAMVGFYDPHEYSGQTHDFFTIVTDSYGTMNFFRQLGKANRIWEYIRDVEATSDGGFIIVGNTGHAGDYHGGLIMKFDNVYNPQWSTYLKRTLPGGVYNLGTPGQRSNIFLTAIKESAAGDYVVVGRSSDHDGSGKGATFRHGLVARITNTGQLTNHMMYARNNSDFLIFHNFDFVSTGDIAITGKTKNPTSNKEHTFLISIDSNFTSLNFSVEYDFDVKNEGLCVWETPSNGFTLTGLTGINGASKKPFVLKTDQAGGSSTEAICDQAFTVTPYFEGIQDLPYIWEENTPNHSDQASSIDSIELCVLLRDCNNLGTPFLRQLDSQPDYEMDDWLDVEPGAVSNNSQLESNNFSLFPNPAGNRITIHYDGTLKPNAKFQIFSIDGQLLREETLRKNNQSIEINELINGVYFIQYENKIEKLVISK